MTFEHTYKQTCQCEGCGALRQSMSTLMENHPDRWPDGYVTLPDGNETPARTDSSEDISDEESGTRKRKQKDLDEGIRAKTPRTDQPKQMRAGDAMRTNRDPTMPYDKRPMVKSTAWRAPRAFLPAALTEMLRTSTRRLLLFPRRRGCGVFSRSPRSASASACALFGLVGALLAQLPPSLGRE